jgi:hypothetical protein
VAATAFGGVAPGPRPSPHRPRSMLRRSGSWRATPADALAEHGVRGPSAPGRRAPSPRGPQAPRREQPRRRSEGPRRDSGHQPRGKHRQEAAAFKQGMDLPPFGATHDRRLELRASRGSCQREGASTVPDNIAGVSRIHAPERSRAPRPCGTLIAGAPPSTCRHPSDWPCRTRRTYASPRPGSTAPMYSYIGRHGDARPVTPDRPRGSFDHGARLNRGPTAAHCSLKCRASAAHA